MNAKHAILLMPRKGNIKLSQNWKHRVRGNRLTDLMNLFCSVRYPGLPLIQQCPESSGTQDIWEMFNLNDIDFEV